MVDFEKEQGKFAELKKLPPNIHIRFPTFVHELLEKPSPLVNKCRDIISLLDPISLREYEDKYAKVMKSILYGDSFLLNLCMKTPISSDFSLKEIFYQASAKYKICLEDEFVCFSPECFIEIKGGNIYSYPMKGTIDADIFDAKNKILSDEKELAEHYTIVDLIRNDLNMVASDVRVKKFRFIDKIITSKKNLLQVSSCVAGVLPKDFNRHIGTIIEKLLPAGSISGAPKKRTVEIIREVENEKRMYYTGICGIFDGKDLDSAVMIRFIEKQDGQLYYRSGCGITCNSDMKSEYNEMIDKIYVPID